MKLPPISTVPSLPAACPLAEAPITMPAKLVSSAAMSVLLMSSVLTLVTPIGSATSIASLAVVGVIVSVPWPLTDCCPPANTSWFDWIAMLPATPALTPASCTALSNTVDAAPTMTRLPPPVMVTDLSKVTVPVV